MSLSIAERQLIELRIRNDGPNIAVAYVLWAVLGLPVSAHRFYLGRPRSAIYQIISVFLLVGVFWWLLDAALISGIIRDQKEAMRQDLIREIEEGREGEAAPAPRRFMSDPAPVAAPAPLAPLPPPATVEAEAAPEPPPAAPDVVLTRSKPQPFGLQSLIDEPIAPPLAAEPVVMKPAPETFGLQAVHDEPIAAPPEPTTASPQPQTEDPLQPAAPETPETQPPPVEAQRFGLRLASDEASPAPAEGEAPIGRVSDS